MPYPYATEVDLFQNIPLVKGDGNNVYFTSANNRELYFNSIIYRRNLNVQYQRETSTYRLDANYDEIIGKTNYLRYKNDTRWFYCFIDSIEYVNPGVCEITFSIDYWMSYQFDLKWKNCFIEREHVTDDTIGANTVPEGLETGEFIQEMEYYPWSGYEYSDGTGNMKMALMCTLSDLWEGVSERLYGVPYGGTINRCYIWAASTYTQDYSLAEQGARLSGLYVAIKQAANIDDTAIFTTYMVPMEFLNGLDWSVIKFPDESEAGNLLDNRPGTTSPYPGYDSGNLEKEFTFDTIDGYVPKNNKLFTSEFNRIIIDNNQGKQMEIYPELLTINGNTGTLRYAIRGSILPGASCTFNIKNYPHINGSGATNVDNRLYSLEYSKFPFCVSNTDVFANWLNGHTASLMVNGISSIANGAMGGAALGGAPGAIAGAATGLLNSVINTTAQVMQHAAIPDQAKGNINNVSSYSNKKLRFDMYKVHVKAEYARIIDNFFTMFGYKVNRLGTPRFGTRQFYNYYKIPQCNVYGDIPGEALNDIRTQFINGITLWNTFDVGNYRDGNNPISVTAKEA